MSHSSSKTGLARNVDWMPDGVNSRDEKRLEGSENMPDP